MIVLRTATDSRSYPDHTYRYIDTNFNAPRELFLDSQPPKTVACVTLWHDQIYSVWTHSQYRRRGYAKRLLQRAIARARQHGLVALHLTVQDGRQNVAATHLYENCGFVWDSDSPYERRMTLELNVREV